MENVPDKMNREEAARYLGVSMSLLAQDIITRRHKFPHVKIGRRVIYLRSALDRFLAAHTVGTTTAA
jgi:hypothetical protein